MVDIKNENPPQVEENSEETLKRLEKTKNKIERSSSIVKGLGIALPIVAGLTWYGITGNGGMMELSALTAFPVVTAVVSAHAFIRDAVERKIDTIKKKVAGSYLISAMLSDQKMRLKRDEQHYDRLTHNKTNSGYSDTADAIEYARKNIEKEKKHEDVFSKAAELAKQEGKEKTIGRLMDMVGKYSDGKTSKYMFGGAIQTAYSLFAAPGALEAISNKSNPFAIACAAAAAVTIPAAVYCATKAVQSIKRKKNADRAFKILEKYTAERT